MSEKSVLEEGVSHLLVGDENVYTLDENSSKNKKLFLSITYAETPEDNDFTSLYKDPECTQLISELRHKDRFNNIFIFDAEENKKIYLKSKYKEDFVFYYKYCSEEEENKIKHLKDSLKVTLKENSGNNKVKIEFECPYATNENKINTKYSIYVSDSGNKNYKVLKDLKLKEKKIIEGDKEKYEVEIDVDTSQKNHFVYVVAESKDPKVSLRPKVVYTGVKIPKKEKESNDTVINAILIVLIIITLIYKFYKKRKKMLNQQAKPSNEGKSDLL